MVEVYKRLKVAVSCLGNHETEYGIPRMTELIKMTKTPWLMANLLTEEGQILDGLVPYHIMTRNGVKIGLFGVCEEEWLGLFSPQKVTEDF